MNLRDLGWCLVGCGLGLEVATIFYDFLMGGHTQNTPESPVEPFSGVVLPSDDKVSVDKISTRENGVTTSVESINDVVESMKKYLGERDYSDYSKKIEEKRAEEEHPLDDDEEPERRPDEGPDEELTDSAFLNFPESDKPRVITLDELAEPWSGTTLSLLYFEGDNTLMEEVSEDLVDDITRMVGNGLKHFGESDPDNPDYVAVRNEAFNVQYEITRVHNSYVDSMFGVGL